MKNKQKAVLIGGVVIAVIIIIVLVVTSNTTKAPTTDDLIGQSTSTPATATTTTGRTPVRGSTSSDYVPGTKPTTSNSGTTATGTARMNTFSNTDWGIEIQYPSGWKAGTSAVLSGSPVVFCPENLASTDSKLVCQMKNNSPYMQDSFAPILLLQVTSQNVTIGSSYTVLGTDRSGRTVYELYLADPSYKKIFDQMVASFRFTR